MELDIYEPPKKRALAPVPRGSFSIVKSVGSFVTRAAGPKRLEPRKGATDKGVAPLLRLQQSGMADSPSPRGGVVNLGVLRNLADRDDIVWSIRRTIRMAIGDMPWKIVPDIDGVKADLKQWETKVLVNLALPGLDLDFVPQAMSMAIYDKATGLLREKLREVIKSGEDPSRSTEVRGFFDNIVAAHEAIALSHVSAVEQIFRQPNPTQTNFRALLDLIIDDLTLFDAACIIKNPTVDGKLGELYNLPGEQITIYRTRDRNLPDPPQVAYDWSVDSKLRAYFNKDELVYMALNPQNNGYGKSPLETLIEQMVGSIYGDAYLVDAFSNNNLPYAVFDAGPNVNEGERKALERAWDERVTNGQHRIIFVANKENVKGFMPIQTSGDKDDTTIEKLKYWANRKTAAYNLSLGDIGFTEDIKAKATAENQSGLSQSRGINSFMRSIDHHINEGIIRGRMWLRDDPEDPNCMTGKSVPCFPFADVKLEFDEASNSDLLEVAERMTSFISAGVMTINEVRKEEKLPPVAGGDTLTLNGQGLIKVEDLPNLPAPPDPSQQQGPPGGGPPQPGGDEQQAQGAPGQDDGAPPNLPGGKPGALPSGGGPPKLKGGDVEKAMNEITHVARTLAKLADSQGGS